MRQLSVSPHQKQIAYNDKDTYFDTQLGRFDQLKPVSATFRRVPTPKYETKAVFFNMDPKQPSRASSAPRLTRKLTVQPQIQEKVLPPKPSKQEFEQLQMLRNGRKTTLQQLERRAQLAENQTQNQSLALKQIFHTCTTYYNQISSSLNTQILQQLSKIYAKLNKFTIQIQNYKPPIIIQQQNQIIYETVKGENSYNRKMPLVAYKNLKDENNLLQKKLYEVTGKYESLQLQSTCQRNELSENQRLFDDRNQQFIALKGQYEALKKLLNEANDEYYQVTFEQNQQIDEINALHQIQTEQVDAKFKNEIQEIKNEYNETIEKLELKIEELKKRKEVE
ncbi:hypothetical protein SS50377_20285 [Spironucleus salmonicida]|uniref:Uncharacterized protein n=1 Tax=Spironucleus salmonicida TaxID=348837 RepID=V6LX02_9EUKA|nr:hypothetical protein SS50377_20285 [Spironucleus salmonicida]|eukprot:EST45339.1 Hypothetical protein SS50377_14917 [Spironucleus salmonicida]